MDSEDHWKRQYSEAAPDMESLQVSIVIVAFNDLEALRKCLASIKKSTYQFYRIVIVDNSLNNAIENEMFRKTDLVYLRPSENIGFSRGCNLGIADSLAFGSKFIWLLNPDTEVDSNCLESLVQCAENHPDGGIIAGRIRFSNAPEKLWYAGGDISYVSAVGKHRVREKTLSNSPIEVSYATGCCMLVPSEVFRRIGPLKEKIFMYLDDAEFCMRVLAAGFKIYYNPFARLSHAVGPGMDFRQYPDYYLYFSIRNKPFVGHGGAYKLYLHTYAIFLGLVKFSIYGLYPGVRNRGSKLKAILAGTWDSLSTESRECIRFGRLFAPRL